MSKQSDGMEESNVFVLRGAQRSVRKLCVLGGLNYIFNVAGDYHHFTDWK